MVSSLLFNIGYITGLIFAYIYPGNPEILIYTVIGNTIIPFTATYLINRINDVNCDNEEDYISSEDDDDDDVEETDEHSDADEHADADVDVDEKCCCAEKKDE